MGYTSAKPGFALLVCIVHATARTTWGNVMTAHFEFASSVCESRAVFRIAVPVWRPRRRERPDETLASSPTREEFKQLLDRSMDPASLAELRLTKAERRQLAAARRVRDALYGSPVRA